jgi:hypothetical protein
VMSGPKSLERDNGFSVEFELREPGQGVPMK